MHRPLSFHRRVVVAIVATIVANNILFLNAFLCFPKTRTTTSFISSNTLPPKSIIFGENSNNDNNNEETTTKKDKVTLPAKKTKKKQVWDHAWVPNGEQRDEVKLLIKEMQREHMYKFREHIDSDTTFNTRKSKKFSNNQKIFLEEGLDVLVRWAQLGEGKRCQKASESILNMVPLIGDDLTEYEYHVKVHRRVLHAYYNQFQRIAWNSKSRKPKKRQLSVSEMRFGKDVLGKADEILKEMQYKSRLYVERARLLNTPRVTLIDGNNDYGQLICGYDRLSMAVPAMLALRRLTDLYTINDYLDRSKPTPELYLAVMKAIYNGNDEEWYQSCMGTTSTTTDIIDMLCRECIEHYASSSPPSLLPLYNVAFDAWDRELSSDDETNNNNNNNNNESDEILKKVNYLWNTMCNKSGKLRPNSKTYLSLINIYTKGAKLDDAYSTVQLLSKYLLKRAKKGTIIKINNLTPLLDSLCTALLSSQKEVVPKRIESIINLLWDLSDVGYDTTPTISFYTTAISAWAMDTSVEIKKDAVAALIHDLKERQLTPDAIFYKDIIQTIAKQLQDDDDAKEKATAIVEELIIQNPNTL